ncbi:MAG: NAD-dependent epimerase/dehydratase family protein, partial [Bryobacteraceae bacterium]
MQIALTGATGFVGRRLVERLLADGHTLRILARRPPAQTDARIQWFTWDQSSGPAPAASVDGADAVVNLAGEPVAQRWNAAVKDKIRASRVNGTKNLVAGMREAMRPPRVLVSASAVGIYGSRGDEMLTEDSAPGTDFLARICRDWEHAADEAQAVGA